jgi:ribosome-associated protein
MRPIGLKSAGGKAVKKKVPPESRELAALVCQAAGEHKIGSPVLINLTGVSQVTDWFYIATCESSRQVRSVAEKIILKLKENGVVPLSQEGVSSGDTRWALIDFGDVMVHFFHPDARAQFDLEGLWADAPREDPGTLARPRSRGSKAKEK